MNRDNCNCPGCTISRNPFAGYQPCHDQGQHLETPAAAGQSRIASLAESVANIAVGFTVALLTQITVFPWFGIDIGIGENLGISAIFTGVSLARSYALRRLFNWAQLQR